MRTRVNRPRATASINSVTARFASPAQRAILFLGASVSEHPPVRKASPTSLILEVEKGFASLRSAGQRTEVLGETSTADRLDQSDLDCDLLKIMDLIRFESTAAKSELLASMSSYLANKTGPLRLERLAARVAGVEWSNLDHNDKQPVCWASARHSGSPPLRLPAARMAVLGPRRAAGRDHQGRLCRACRVREPLCS